MRIHRLTLSAFGPFPGSHSVDFEELNDAGVFLVTGSTGAGKTSLLDAVCFALFGQVPGARGVKALKSDHAPPDARPEVVLEFSLGDRRFVVRRSPEWHRPKKRREGLTYERGAASLLEVTGGVERLVSSRAQEVGHYLSDLLGMTASQFQQVAMLPQGEFQTFLRATSQERHDVLQQLFRTERFTRIETWVQDHSKRLREQALSGEAAVRRLVDTMADRAGLPTPVGLDPEHLSAAASAGMVEPWADDLVSASTSEADRTSRLSAAAVEAASAARVALDQATRTRQLLARRAAAEATLAESDVAELERLRDLLDADDRAQRCGPVLRLVADSERRRSDLTGAVEAARRAAPDSFDVEAEQRALVETRARLTSLRPRREELLGLRRRGAAARCELESLAPRLAGTQEVLETLPQRRLALRAALDAAQTLAGTKDSLTVALRQAQGRAQAAGQLPQAERTLQALRESAHHASEGYADARSRLLDLVERRLAGMAAELAGELREGSPCQVCGSTVHPAPASANAGAVTEADQVGAQAEVDALRAVHQAEAARAQEAEIALERLRSVADGLDATQADAQVLALGDDLTAAVAAEQEVVELTQRLAELEAQSTALSETLRRDEADQVRLATELAAQEESAVALHAALAEEIGDHPDLEAAVASVEHRLAALRAVADAERALEQADEAHQRQVDAAGQTVIDNGFDDAEAARSAALSSEVRTQLEEGLAAQTAARAAAETTLIDPDLVGLPDVPPDLEAALAHHQQAAAAETAAVRASHLAEEACTTLARQRAELATALAAWAPARERFLTADGMARLVRGMGADNQLQMRLSAYVLATRLDQVVDAANERLAHMREQRYQLQRTGQAARKGSQAGLGLSMVDLWTGETRDPATLSGGETFVVSLALALGLSDVVTAESGGVELGTLFIDEGFGLLDPDTLDDVMDRLDGLRAGGRTVGVVSHVTELRNRIPTQVHVDKQRDGSSVSVTTLIA